MWDKSQVMAGSLGANLQDNRQVDNDIIIILCLVSLMMLFRFLLFFPNAQST